MKDKRKTAVRGFGRRRGMTLTEMIVAVGLTIMMLSMVGIVFKSATEATGKAQANNDIMHQLRAVTSQLEKDFRGFRPDLPFAVVWEMHSYNYNDNTKPNFDPTYTFLAQGDPDDKFRAVRYDRIVFFANGDFQTADGPGSPLTVSSNLARIFYGQSFDTPETPKDTAAYEPRRKLLTRRVKLLTADTSVRDATVVPPGAENWGSWFYNNICNITQIPGYGDIWRQYTATKPLSYAFYDCCPIENETVAFWKNQLFPYFQNWYFRTDFSTSFSAASFVRRPNISAIQTVSSYNGVQRLYMLPDVTDFKIELLFPPNPPPTGSGIPPEWFPNERDASLFFINSLILPFYGKIPAKPQQFAFYWNVPHHGNLPLGTGLEIPGNPWPYTTYWRSENDIGAIATGIPALGWNPTNVWPAAIKFTFTLYDKNRRYFPEGQTFEYIVKLPPRN